ncbi:MAG: hypothetical protein E6Q97_16910 [Desulfurellales bacterium]|nr:MAG: hypothetical protein E6Q97_16910 [Desulfurellales bacterium]
MIEQIVARVFFTRNAAHTMHWRTTGVGSYATHMALGSFYEDIIGAIDDLVESYQGRFGLIGAIPDYDVEDANIVSVLQSDVDFIEANRDSITQGVSGLQNLLDELHDIYLRTLYKLKNLS